MHRYTIVLVLSRERGRSFQVTKCKTAKTIELHICIYTSKYYRRVRRSNPPRREQKGFDLIKNQTKNQHSTKQPRCHHKTILVPKRRAKKEEEPRQQKTNSPAFWNKTLPRVFTSHIIPQSFVPGRCQSLPTRTCSYLPPNPKIGTERLSRTRAAR